MPTILIVGATRGLGASLANTYASDSTNEVYGTTRTADAPTDPKLSAAIKWVPNIDLMKSSVGATLVKELGVLGVGGSKGFDVLIITAGVFTTEDFETGPNWDNEIKMYTTSAIAPPTLITSLFHAHLLPTGSKILLVTSESGSIALRHPKEGGGNYGHHASKAASNMVGRLLSLDLAEHGVIVSIVHPGFMRTEMTAGVGFAKYYDDAGAVTPQVAAETLREWVDGLDMSKSGQYWAPRGGRDIGTAEPVLGENLPTPLQLPW